MKFKPLLEKEERKIQVIVYVYNLGAV